MSYMRHVLEICHNVTAACEVYSGPVEAKIKWQYQCQILHINIKCSMVWNVWVYKYDSIIQSSSDALAAMHGGKMYW